MDDLDTLRSLLLEIRDNQRTGLEQQAEQVALAREQADRAKRQIEESLALQREAIAKQRTIMRLAVPGIALCMAAILYLVFRYF